MVDPVKLHSSCLIIDAVSPLAHRGDHLDDYIAGGVDVLCPTVAVNESAAGALRNIGLWHRLLRERDNLALVREAEDIARARAEGRLGIVLHFQNTAPIEDDLDLIDAYAAAGVKMIQLTYNARNRVGDGCEEPSDAGLSRFGAALVDRLEAARVIVDCSHTGYRTTMEAIDRCQRPPVVSHANAYAVHPSPRNLRDDTIRAIAERGGLVGVVGYPAFVCASARPRLDDLIAHMEHLVEVGGVANVGLGLDYYKGQHPYCDDQEAARLYAQQRASGAWSDAYPPPPWHYPAGIETPAGLPALTRALCDRGWQSEHIAGVLGGNWLRVFGEVWGC